MSLNMIGSEQFKKLGVNDAQLAIAPRFTIQFNYAFIFLRRHDANFIAKDYLFLT